AVRARLKAEGIAPLYAELLRRDPGSAAHLMPGDRSRITRALEVVLATGRSLADWHRDGMKPALDPERAVRIFLAVERGELYRRPRRRRGARGGRPPPPPPALPAPPEKNPPGGRWWFGHQRGKPPPAGAAEGGRRPPRRYTKRQGTWFRHQLPDFAWAGPAEAE